MSAAEIAARLGNGVERRSGRGWRTRCPAHQDRHPSFDIEDRGDRVVFVCRSQRCSQAEIVAGLRARGLWGSHNWRSTASSSRGITHVNMGAAPEIPACCLAPQRCVHWQEFERQVLVANLLGNLDSATGEIVERYATARRESLDASRLVEESNDAIPFGAIVPAGIDDADIIAKAVNFTVRKLERGA